MYSERRERRRSLPWSLLTRSSVERPSRTSSSRADRGGQKFRTSRVDLPDKGRERPACRARARRGVSKRDHSSLGHMKHLTSVVLWGVALSWGLFASGCAANRAHSTCSGATQSEVDQVLRAACADADDDDYSNNDSLPEWKQDCIRKYNRCQDRRWMGNCHDCMRLCEGQHEWPEEMCKPRR